MFSYLCSSHTPADVRKAASNVSADRPASLQQRLKGAYWGAYDVHETEPHGSTPGRLGLTASVLLFHEAYPNMAPGTARYVMQLSSGGGAVSSARGTFANNAALQLKALAIESTGGELESLPAPTHDFVFLPFDGPLPPKPKEEKKFTHYYASGQT